MQKKKSIKDDERDPLVSYFRALEKEIPEADIEEQWSRLVRKVNDEPVPEQRKHLRIYMQIACMAALLAGIFWGIKLYRCHYLAGTMQDGHDTRRSSDYPCAAADSDR